MENKQEAFVQALKNLLDAAQEVKESEKSAKLSDAQSEKAVSDDAVEIALKRIALKLTVLALLNYLYNEMVGKD